MKLHEHRRLRITNTTNTVAFPNANLHFTSFVDMVSSLLASAPGTDEGGVPARALSVGEPLVLLKSMDILPYSTGAIDTFPIHQQEHRALPNRRNIGAHIFQECSEMTAFRSSVLQLFSPNMLIGSFCTPSQVRNALDRFITSLHMLHCLSYTNLRSIRGNIGQYH